MVKDIKQTVVVNVHTEKKPKKKKRKPIKLSAKSIGDAKKRQRLLNR